MSPSASAPTKEEVQAAADLEFWQGVFDHMLGWQVIGWSYRDSVQVRDDRGQYHSYSSARSLPIIKAKEALSTENAELREKLAEREAQFTDFSERMRAAAVSDAVQASIGENIFALRDRAEKAEGRLAEAEKVIKQIANPDETRPLWSIARAFLSSTKEPK